MNNKLLFGLAFVAISFLIFMTSCSQQKTEWKGTIEKVDGVTVITNPKEPMYEGDVCILEEEFSLGEDQKEGEPKVVSMRDMHVDNEGNIYILDSDPLCIKIFNKTGTLIRKFGSEGQGPGEWQTPYSFALHPNGHIIVNDWGNQRLTFFSNQGELIKEISTVGHPNIARVYADSIGNVYAAAIPTTRELRKHVVYKLDENQNLALHFKTGEEKRIPSAEGNVINMEFPVWSETASRDGFFICNYRSKYEFRVFDIKGKEVRKILKDYTPKSIGEKEKQRMVEERFRPFGGIPKGYIIKFPEYFNPVLFKFIINDEGMLVVGTPDRDETGSYYNDIFDSEGRYITKIPLKYNPLVWKNGKVYFMETNDEGFQYIKRYKATWKT